jgi:hyperosmotically inducible periplasmic protein
MSYDEEQQRRSRVVIETPTARREVVRTETARVPDRQGISTGVVAALVIGAVALTTILFLFLINRQQDDSTNANVRVATTAPTPLPQQPVIIQQPAPQTSQPPIIVEQPASQPPVVITQPSTTTSSSSTTETRSKGPDDSTIQSAIDKKLSDDPKLESLGVIATVIDGKVTLTGSVDTPDLKRQVETLVKRIEGVRSVDNQITVAGG